MKINNRKNTIISNFVSENCSPVKHEKKVSPKVRLMSKNEETFFIKSLKILFQ